MESLATLAQGVSSSAYSKLSTSSPFATKEIVLDTRLSKSSLAIKI